MCSCCPDDFDFSPLPRRDDFRTAICVRAPPDRRPAGTSEQGVDPVWQEIRERLMLRGGDAIEAEGYFLDLFEREYTVASPVEALMSIKAFMGEFLVQEFDYQNFCMTLGTTTAKTMDQEGAWKRHISKHLIHDLTLATALMLRMASTIALTYGLQDDDWKDINVACGKAVRAVPACYKLQRELPGALNDARSLRYLLIPTTDAGRDLNPWRSEDGKLLFEQAHGIQWTAIEAFSRQDTEPKVCFTCRCAVEEITFGTELASVYLKIVEVADPPGGKPSKDVQEGDPILWEIETQLAEFLQPGFTIAGDWYEMQNEVCFMSSVASVGPGW